MSGQQTEAEIIDKLVPELQAEGYEVYLHPHGSIVPDFLGAFEPDLLAFRGSEKIVVEVKRKSKEAERQVQSISHLLKDRPDWHLRLIWLDPVSESSGLTLQTKETIQARLSEVKSLISIDQRRAAMLLAWATFEGIARAIANDAFKRPQTPGRLISVLAADGTITPSEADMLRRLVDKRNRLIHGELTESANKNELDSFVQVLSHLADNVA